MRVREWALPVLILAGIADGSICRAEAAASAAAAAVESYRLKMPDARTDIWQASGLHFGRLGRREGLWLICDRNSSASANQVFFVDRKRLSEARPDAPIVAGEAMPVVAPAEGWDAFAKRHSTIPADVLAELKRQFDNAATGDGPLLDFEGIAIAPGIAGEPAGRLFVVAEQPNSLVLELEVFDRGAGAQAVLKDCFAYPEGDQERGGDSNDGLEGIAWTGRRGEFYLAEEGTRPHSAGNLMLFFHSPRLMRCTLADGRVVVDEPWSGEVTRALRALQKGPTHTLNEITVINDDTVLAVDRNGGWIFAVNPRTRTVRAWLNLYDPDLLSLRERLADFPGPRGMPYVSIEGLARDADGNLWMVDDPAMPEPFRESCLIRLRNPPPFPK